MIDANLGHWRLSLTPREWQRSALKLWTSEMRGIVRVVTGAGKTAFGELCIEAFINRYPEGKIVIIVPSVVLLDQWYVTLREELGVLENELACYSGDSHPPEPQRVNILILNTARKAASPISTQSTCFLIVDECHHAASPENAKALGGSYKATLGLSATPERDYDLGFETVLVPRLGDLIFDYDYSQASKDGVITPFDLINVSADLLSDEQAEYDKVSRSIAKVIHRPGGNLVDANREMVRRLLQKRAAIAANATVRIPVALRLLENHRGERALIFHERIQAAEKLCSLLNERHHNAALYHSLMNPILRRDNLRLFRRGVFDVLVTCRALDEGMNVPETTVAVIASSTASTRQRIQRLGRVLRPIKGKDKAVIYTIYTTKVEEERLRKEADGLSEAASIEWRRSSIRSRCPKY